MQTHYVILFKSRLFVNRKSVEAILLTFANYANDIFRDIVWNIWFIFLILWQVAWLLLRQSFCFFLVVWDFLQYLTMLYIVINTIFLINFCQYHLSIVRNLICKSWDELQRNEDFSTINLNAFFENILQNDEKIIFYELSYHVARYQIKIRFFRVIFSKIKYFVNN